MHHISRGSTTSHWRTRNIWRPKDQRGGGCYIDDESGQTVLATPTTRRRPLYVKVHVCLICCVLLDKLTWWHCPTKPPTQPPKTSPWQPLYSTSMTTPSIFMAIPPWQPLHDNPSMTTHPWQPLHHNPLIATPLTQPLHHNTSIRTPPSQPLHSPSMTTPPSQLLHHNPSTTNPTSQPLHDNPSMTTPPWKNLHDNPSMITPPWQPLHDNYFNNVLGPFSDMKWYFKNIFSKYFILFD